MPEIKIFRLNAAKVNSRGGTGASCLVEEMIRYMLKQSRVYGECTLMVFEGNSENPKKKGKNTHQDEKIEMALRRICRVMQDAVDPERIFDGNIEKIDVNNIYQSIEVHDGVTPLEPDIHCYKIVWRREIGYNFKNRLKKEIETGIIEAVYRTWDPKNIPSQEAASNN